MNRCPLFGKCGGCKFDFTSPDYNTSKKELLNKIPVTDNPKWIAPGGRRRADFAFLDNDFGFYAAGSKNVIPVDHCSLLTDKINEMLPAIASMPWAGSGSVLVTECDNGIDIAVTSGVPYFSTEFKKAVDTSRAIRITWNGKVIKETVTPVIKFEDVTVEYPPNAFLQPSQSGETVLRDLVKSAVFDNLGPDLRRVDKKKVADLFCGLGSFTFSLNADGFDIFGNGVQRDLFKKPLTVQNLKKYDCVIMDPPRAGAMAQSKQLAKSSVPTIVYVSCNPDTFMRDADILEKGGYKLTRLTPVDQFIGSSHWELVGVFKSPSSGEGVDA